MNPRRFFPSPLFMPPRPPKSACKRLLPLSVDKDGWLETEREKKFLQYIGGEPSQETLTLVRSSHRLTHKEIDIARTEKSLVNSIPFFQFFSLPHSSLSGPHPSSFLFPPSSSSSPAAFCVFPFSSRVYFLPFPSALGRKGEGKKPTPKMRHFLN